MSPALIFGCAESIKGPTYAFWHVHELKVLEQKQDIPIEEHQASGL